VSKLEVRLGPTRTEQHPSTPHAASIIVTQPWTPASLAHKTGLCARS
jgi:hypothetical protein